MRDIRSIQEIRAERRERRHLLWFIDVAISGGLTVTVSGRFVTVSGPNFVARTHVVELCNAYRAREYVREASSFAAVGQQERAH